MPPSLWHLFRGLAHCPHHGLKDHEAEADGRLLCRTAGAITLFGTALAASGVSTTHTITGAIVGVGAINRLSAVRWGIAARIIWAWVLTMPASAMVSAATFGIIRLLNRNA